MECGNHPGLSEKRKGIKQRAEHPKASPDFYITPSQMFGGTDSCTIHTLHCPSQGNVPTLGVLRCLYLGEQ